MNQKPQHEPDPLVYLQPGDLLLVQDYRLISTVLGSCVAVTMHHAGTGCSAICHGTFPEPNLAVWRPTVPFERFKFLSEAIPHMVDWFKSKGVRPVEIETKVFGGAAKLGQGSGPEAVSIGKLNMEYALGLLEKLAIPIKAGNVGGNAGRKIVFNTQTGEVLHRFL